MKHAERRSRSKEDRAERDVNAKFVAIFGSRAFSVQVNIVAVSVHVFHRFPYDLLTLGVRIQLSSLFLL